MRKSRLPNGVYRRQGRHGPTWSYSFSYRGQRVQKCLGPVDALSVNDVIAARNLAVAEAIRSGEALPQKRRCPSMKELFEKYKESIPEGSNRLVRANQHFGHLIEILSPGLAVDQLSHVTLMRYRAERGKQRINVKGTDRFVKPATINRELSTLRAALHWAKGQPSLGVREIVFGRLSSADRATVFPREQGIIRPIRLSDEDVAKIAAEMSESYRPAVWLALYTGMRRGEVTGLTWEQVHEAGPIPHVRPTKTKSGKPREVPLCDAARRLLPARPKGGGVVFHGAHGAALNNLDRVWSLARERAGLPRARFHDLRHEWASRYIEAGGDLRSLMEIGGWSSLELVERYSHPAAARALEILNRAASLAPVLSFPTATSVTNR